MSERDELEALEQPERWEILVNKAVDGVLSEDEERELEALVAGSAEREDELADLRAIKSATDGLRARIRASYQVEPARPSAPLRAWWAALGAVGALGLASVLGLALFALASDPSAPRPLVWGVLAIAAALILALGTLAVRRLRTKTQDPYEEIDR